METEVNKIVDKVDYVIGMYHGGFERDLKQGNQPKH